MNRIPFALLMTFFVFAVGCKDAEDAHDHEKPGHAEATAYHCPMHPQIIQEKPGDCPICGMDLVKFSKGTDSAAGTGTESTQEHAATGPDVRVDPAVVQKIGVRTETVDAGVLGREFRADAEGILDESAEISITIRSMGYLESVSSFREGDRVKAGQILATLYSPELVAAQGDWLAAHRRGDSAGAMASREQLRSLGFPEASFAKALEQGRPLRTIPVASPATGWVRARSATRGQSAMAGTELFRIVEGSGTILQASLAAGDAALVKIGDVVQVRGDGLTAPFAARVVSVAPEVERATRSTKVRLAAAKGSEIRVGALYRATFQSRKETGFVIPGDAILHSGSRDVVFLDLGDGRFRPVEVVLGPSSGGKTLVRTGIEAGDEVVVSAQFLLDGESRLQAALDQLTRGDKK
jgi:Cu(I)/Ag(I) efflux system membrane fusion protein